MKLNKILMAFAAMAIVGCTSEDLNDFNAKQAPADSRMIQLGENFAIAGVGVDDATTRTHWSVDGSGAVVNVFLPIYAKDGIAGEYLSSVAARENVGLCWLSETVGEKVYTNYQFYHNGWLNVGQTLPNFDKCDNSLKNGAWYDEITLATSVYKDDEAVPATDFTLPSPKCDGGINYNSGIYKTDNKAIFGGKYIVYYPFNEEFKEVGTIPALAVTQFGDGVATSAPQTVEDPALGEATFRYSKNAVDIKGGDQAAGFGLTNLSELLQLKVYTPASDANIGKKIDRIVLYSKSGKLLKQANLCADKIVAGKKGAELYAEGSTVGTKTITINFKPGDEITLNKESLAPLGAFITVLPTTVEDLQIFVHNQNDKKWAVIDKLNQKFDAAADRIKVSVSASDFKSNYFAVDQTSLEAALTEAGAGPATIEVIGDITLTSNLAINAPNVTIKGDKIIVPENVTLELNTKMESDIRVLGKECCGAAPTGGRLTINGGQIANVTMEPTKVEGELTEVQYTDYNPLVTYAAAATIAAGTDEDPVLFDAQAGTINVDAAVAHKANINIAEGVTVTVSATGDLNFMGAKVVNDGTIEVKKQGKFDMTNKDGNATASDGKRMTNNGTFIHNVDAAVGTAVQSMNQNGEYRCRVDKQIKLDDAYQKWTACSVIEMVGAGQAYNLGVAEKNIEYKHNGKFIDIEVNTTSLTTFNNPADGDGNGDNKNIQVGKLTVMKGGLYVPFVKGDGKRELTVNGDMTVSVTSSLYSSKKITVKENLIVNKGATLKYAGENNNEGGLAVEKDIKVSAATFDASILLVDALDITCANFTLADGATAKFGNRTEGDTKNLTVSGTITNPTGCTFDIIAANQVGGSILATVTCKTLIVGGNWGVGGKPQVVE